MSSNVLAAFLFGGFLIYVTAKGSLTNYISIFFGTSTGSNASQANAAVGGVPSSLTTPITPGSAGSVANSDITGALAGTGTVGAGVAGSDIIDTGMFP